MKTLLCLAVLLVPVFPPRQDLDGQLVGAWIYTINDSRGSGHTFVEKVTHLRWVFNADGTYERGSSLGAGVSREAAKRSNGWSEPTERGVWHTQTSKLYITSVNGQPVPEFRHLAGSYYIEGNTMVFTATDGKKAIWHK